MSERKEYPAGVPCYVDSGRKDPQAAMDFYGGLFGWEFENMSPEGAPRYFSGKIDGRVVAGVGEQPDMDWAPVWNTYVRVDDADAAAADVEKAGGKVTLPPFDIGPAGRMAAFDDREGASLCVWQPGMSLGAEEVNGAGSWVFSTLHSADRAAAEAFYDSVFGWRFGEAGDPLVMKPGYLDFLTQDDPELPGRLEEMGAPEGFGDVVATTRSAGDGVAPHWEITFGVEDCDVSAARVNELGGTVVVEPFDAPWVRAALVRDTDGVEFTISQFVPPEN